MAKGLMVPIIAIVGRSRAGKTCLMERLIAELKGRGFRVAAVKHTHHHDFEIDKEGKDSWRHKKAGASPVAISSQGRLAVIMDRNEEVPLTELRDRFLSDVDIILAEGFRTEEVPKIEVLGEGRAPSATHLIAQVGESSRTIPSFSPDEVKELADFIEGRFLK